MLHGPLGKIDKALGNGRHQLWMDQIQIQIPHHSETIGNHSVGGYLRSGIDSFQGSCRCRIASIHTYVLKPNRLTNDPYRQPVCRRRTSRTSGSSTSKGARVWTITWPESPRENLSGRGTWPWVKIQIVAPSDSIPTKIDSKMGGEFTETSQNGIPLVLTTSAAWVETWRVRLSFSLRAALLGWLQGLVWVLIWDP